MLDKIHSEVIASLFYNVGDPKPATGVREYLAEETRWGRQPFTNAVHWVNNNLASWGKEGLSDKKARDYTNDARLVELGELSNTSAFLRSSVGWVREGNIFAAAMNATGALAAGAVDHQRYLFEHARR
ncbi:hypothetical protein P5705_14025 [Pseudomonas entomophila]|uniref:hypothetical protein n=1 Tax=Pseudomonas entomophila TaxID=312306 RepID=UPI00240721E8|nr:hypothetical protein [Pseudomonas entomophila]MDF9618765.1 hypothetical protein [Pseudomonas entomophila]